MTDVLAAVASLSPERRALLALRNPLSFAQQRLWFLEQLGGAGAAYHLPSALRLTGRLDVAALQRSLDEVVSRHEALRATFLAPDGEPIQIFAKHLPVPLRVADASGLPAEEHEAAVARWLADEVGEPFDLARGALRAGLLRLGDEEHVLAVTMHHIVTDGWSLNIFVREMAALYAAFSRGEASPLPAEAPAQYGAFVRWQRERLQGERLAAEVGYWRDRLEGAPPVLELPLDRPRPRVQSFRGASHWVHLGDGLTREVREFSRGAGTTVFSTVLAAFTAVVSRLAAQDDVVLGTPVAGRTRAELESAIGMFINTLVLRTRVDPEESFTELLRRVRKTVLDAQAHQEVPFEKIVEELQPERRLSHAPVFQVLVAELVGGPEAVSLPGLTLTPLDSAPGTSRFDLTLSIAEVGGALAGKLEYNTDLFDAATVARLGERFRAVLAAAVRDPALRIHQLPLLLDDERAAVLAAAADATPAEVAATTVCAAVERHAAEDGARPAVAFEGRELSYEEVNRRANRIAHGLRRLGVAPGDRVALYVERSLEMVPALLGILKAGAVYVPLDPEHPRERAAWVLGDCAPALVLTQQHLAAALPAAHRAVALDAGAFDGDAETDPSPVAPEQAAYVIYTSGSTGRPKGVQVSHRALWNLLASMAAEPGLSADDTLLAVTTLTFDISLLELLLPLAVGARVVVAAAGVAADGEALAELLAREGATVMQATPSGWRVLVESGWEGDRSLRMLCGGEALPADLAEALLARGGELWNVYGPTETTIWSAVHRVVHGGGVPLGHPVANTEIHVLDAFGAPQPFGVPGEVHIGGRGVADGYLGRPALTAERFVPHPFAARGGERLYRTGDLARRRADGSLEFLGRADNQVKVRGFRIELGEIEAVLQEHPQVREAAVALQPGERLAAFAAGAGASGRELLAYLRERLPAYMVPASCTVLDALPRSPSGKIDRARLPVADVQVESAEYVAPRTPLEETVAEAWGEALGRARVGAHDNFFELGGHSLLAARVMHRLRRELGVSLPLHVLFEHPTVAGLAREAARRRAEPGGGAQALAPIVPDPQKRYEPFPLTDVQQAYWVGRSGSLELGNVSSHSYTEFELQDVDLERLTQALRGVIERHEMLRAIVLPDGRQQILAEVPPYEIAATDLRGLGEAEREAHLARVRDEMSHEVLPADRWPLFGVRASILPGERVRIHFSLDYLIADAWSTRIIFDELAERYADPGVHKPPLALSFRDCVLAAYAEEGSEAFRRAEAYWRERLADLPPAPELPLAMSPDQLVHPRFVRRTATLEAPRWERLKALAARAGLTPSGVLLAAFSEVLSAWSKNPRVTINLTLFNRPPAHPDVDAVVGDFTALSLLGIEAPGTEAFEVRARRVQEQLWRDMEHGAVSGVRVLRDLARMQGRPPASLMPIVFTSVLGQPRRAAGASLGAPAPAALDGDAPVYSITQTPQVWLDHQVLERDGALAFNWDAVEELFSPGVLDAMWESYRELLERLAASEEAWHDGVGARLPAAQLARRAMVNATDAPVPAGLLHEPFEAQARTHGERLAVVAGERRMSYAELERRSRALGLELRARGARPNRLVAVVMDKGWEQVVAVLGITRAGAAYLPIDASLPAERIAQLLSVGEVEIAVVQPEADARISWPAGIERIRIEAEEPALDPAAVLPAVAGPEDLAYVIFTSGSTGVPKGVMIDHRGALNTVVDCNQRYAVGPDDRVLGLSALNFDLSVYDIFGLLAAGGAVVLPDAGASRDPETWAALVAAERVTVWNSVPALMEMMAHYAADRADDRLKTLRVVMLSGDWLPVTLPDRIRALCPAEVHSLGGATEASIWSITYPVGEVRPEWTSIPYGVPMVNQRFHVLDERLQPRPEWVPGQLHIAGIGLAQGYWQDAEKTGASFITHPRTGERLYRTGDLGRYLPDGNIEFLGREDFQVKVQGHRIELGEIEAVLEQHPAVRGGVAAAVGERNARRLAGFVVLHPSAEATPAELRDFLASRLPAYMVPASITPLDAFPLSLNGKVDRGALAALVQPDAPAPERAARARTPLEERVAAVWAEILGVDDVELDANLYALGGNSILAVRIVNRVAEALGVQVPLRQLFQAPTVEGMAAIVRRLKEEKVREAELSVQEHAIVPDVAGRHEPFPLNDVQHAYWMGRTGLFQLGNVAAHSYSEYDVRGLDLERLNVALRRVIDRHDMLRAVLTPDGQQRILPEVPPYRIEVLDLRGRPADEAEAGREALRHRMSHQVIPAERWPLFEVAASVVDDDTVRLHVSIDILFVDAWSGRLLWRDLARFYQDPALELPPLELSFRDYVLAEARFRESPRYQRAREYWFERAATLPGAPDLPFAKDLGAVTQPRFERRSATLDRAQWERLRARAARAGLTPSGVLLAAYAEVLGRWSRNSRFTLNLTLFNRLPLHPQVNEVVGDHTTLNLLEVDLSRGDGFESRAQAIQERLWEDLEHRFVGGVEVLREMGRRQGRSPAAVTPVVFTSSLFGEAFASADGDGELEMEHVFGVSQTPQVWLDQQVMERDGALAFNWDAVEELFSPGVLDAMWESYRELLERLATSEEAWHDGVGARLPAAQLARRAMVNATDAPVPAGLLHEPFEAQALRHPDRLAVVAGERRMSYAELERRSRALGLELRARGARPNRLVAVVMEKGWEQVVAVLGITRAGAAYLPIDASLPAERIAQLLSVGEVEIAVVQPEADARVQWPEGIERIRIEPDEPALDPAAALPAVAGPEDLAYVIFTSGSTGVPKGVMIDHRGALNTVVDCNQRYAVGPDDRVLGLSALNFDLSVYDIFGLLAAGGAVVLPDAGASRDPETWAALVAAERVTVWNSVPALMEMMAHYAADRADDRLKTLRVVMLSGDWLPVTLPDRIRALCPAEVHSLGGATEASIWSITYPVGEVRPEWTSIPYGVPMVNQRFHVLDERLQPRPEWVPGQLHIAGIGLAQGYWQDAEKTGASFITHPRTGERLYRTGDLGRYLPDGTIEFLGREDFQVKVQGHRIELGEIEAVLEQHPAVRGGVAAAVGERNARRLVAYVTPRERGAAAGPRRGDAALRLARTLASLRQVRTADLPLPKYGYPSAGNLYPVQAYVAVPAGTDGIDAATYYYDPRGHRLVRVAGPLPAELAGGDGPAVFLVARLDAIAPVYGVLAPDFCLLEAGYVQVLLADAAAREGLAATPATLASPERVREHLGLDSNHVPLQCLHLGAAGVAPAAAAATARTAWAAMSSLLAGHLSSGAHAALGKVEALEFKLSEPGLRSARPGDAAVALGGAPEGGADLMYRASDREFLRGAIPHDTFHTFLAKLGDALPASLAGASTDGLSVGVYLALGAVHGLAPGGYRYDPRAGTLSPVAPEAVIAPEVHAQVNRAVFEGSAFSLFLCANPADAAARDALLLLAGGVGQALMAAGPEMGVGICPVGSLDFDRVRPVVGAGGDAVLLHSFVGGRIPPRARPAVSAAVAETTASAASTVADPAATAELSESVRQFLASRLPDYMVPKRIVVLDEFPLSANGKVDRKALPRVDEADAPSFTAARTPVEETLAGIWRELLGVERVGVDDAFFVLGGDSVKAIQFLARAREAGVEIAVRDFFQNPRISALAKLVEPGAGGNGATNPSADAGAPAAPVVADAELTQEELDLLIAEFGGNDGEDPFA
ncbi:MAG TPA: amino acid adenylation domain-containing protein [Longimicrobium sp.]